MIHEAKFGETSRPYEVHVECDPQDGLWTGVNEEIGLFLQAESYEALIEEAWLTAPDLLELNGLGAPADGLRLKFSMTTSAAERRAL